MDRIFAPPAFDRLGRGGRIMVQREYVYRTLMTESMEGLIDARLGERPTLRDVEEFRLLAEGFVSGGRLQRLPDQL